MVGWGGGGGGGGVFADRSRGVKMSVKLKTRKHGK